MKKRIIPWLLTFIAPCCLAQTAEVFKGGAGDGYQKSSIVQQSATIWLGGNGDGFVHNTYTQASPSIYTGGNGDGFVRNTYTQSSSSIYNGGIGDGFVRSNYLQASEAIWLGGYGDGHADSNYIQSSVSFWLGGEGDGWASSYRPEGPLPVRFGAFTAEKKSETQALLKWNTLSESNSSHFEIERSTNAVNFIYIDKVNAFGNSTTTKDYTYTDYKVLTGNNYFRLKQVDKDGKFVYTPTRMVMFNIAMPASIRIFPNPASSYIVIDRPTAVTNEKIVINMMDMKGNMVKQWKMPTSMNVQSRLSVQGLPKGTYIIHIIGEKSNSLHKIMIQ